MTRAEFVAAYAAELLRRAAIDPEYGDMTAERATATAERMVAPLAAGRADIHGSPVLRALSRRFGIAHTIAGWRAFAAGLTADDPVRPAGHCAYCAELAAATPGATIAHHPPVNGCTILRPHADCILARYPNRRDIPPVVGSA